MAAERSRWSRGAALAGITMLAAGAAGPVIPLAERDHA